jgi:hypothetical protein
VSDSVTPARLAACRSNIDIPANITTASDMTVFRMRGLLAKKSATRDGSTISSDQRDLNKHESTRWFPGPLRDEVPIGREGLPLLPAFVKVDTHGGISGNGAIGDYAPTP